MEVRNVSVVELAMIRALIFLLIATLLFSLALFANSVIIYFLFDLNGTAFGMLVGVFTGVTIGVVATYALNAPRAPR